MKSSFSSEDAFKKLIDQNWNDQNIDIIINKAFSIAQKNLSLFNTANIYSQWGELTFLKKLILFCPSRVNEFLIKLKSALEKQDNGPEIFQHILNNPRGEGTPLWIAFTPKYRMEIANALIRMGANPFYKVENNKTVFDLAIQSANFNFISFAYLFFKNSTEEYVTEIIRGKKIKILPTKFFEHFFTQHGIDDEEIEKHSTVSVQVKSHYTFLSSLGKKSNPVEETNILPFSLTPKKIEK